MACGSHDCGCGKAPATPAAPAAPAAPKQRRALPVLGASAGASSGNHAMAQAAPHAHGGASLPSPIPWLGKIGEVEALDGAVVLASAAGPAGAPGAGISSSHQPGSDVASTRKDARADADRLRAEMARRTRARLGAAAAELGLGTPGEGAGEGTGEALAIGSSGRGDAGGLVAASAAAAAGGIGAAGRPARPKKLDPSRPGSGIPARRAIRVLVWVRRAAQSGFFALFMFFLFQTTFRGSFSAKAGDAVRLPLPVEGFLLADPFVAAMTLLSTHTVYRGLLWSVGMLALTMVFGRVFCGWICPFGTLHQFTAWLFPSRVGRGASRVEANKTHVYQRAKYYLLYAFLLSAVAGSAIGGLFDPICICVRAIGLGVMPAAQYIAGHGFAAATDTNSRIVQSVADGSQDFLTAHVWNARQFYFHQTWFICFLLVAILFMNRFIPRFWCRVLCPLGAFLGVFARFALFGMEKDHAKCTDCNLCIVHCQGADSPQGGVKHRQDECHMCLNCENACPEDVIKFRFLPDRRSTTNRPDTGRRTALAAAGAGMAVIPAMRIADSIDANYHPRVIRPPGSVEEREFLERCIRCAECMKVCPNNALHPAFFESGVEGLWTPILIPRIGYCEHSCVLCGQVCPTGAIQKITEKEKMGIGQKPISIGTAFYDVGRCLPWAMSTPCIVCEEFCPTSPKAIWVEEVDIPRRSDKRAPDGKEPEMLTVHVQRPHVDPSLCIGCGACEKVCPVQDQPAVYVTSVGETRSKTNVILLEGESYNRTT
jgi:polyferredoxin